MYTLGKCNIFHIEDKKYIGFLYYCRHLRCQQPVDQLSCDNT